MTFLEWFIFFLVIQLVHFLGTWKLYVKAGRKAWEAAVPVYNAVVLMGILNRPKWWTILLFFPIVNLLMFPVIWVETCRSFGKNSRPDTILAVVTLGLYIFYINYATDVKYVNERSLKPRSAVGEWVSSILFAIIAATLVHTYFMQPFVIPTSSLEKTLLKGDFLLVSKFHYGARLPMTAVAAPMVHDTLPKINTKSYLKEPQLPYTRIPGFQKIKRNDIVVFNWPVDTLFNMYIAADKKYEKPIDKKTNYVKRCVGIAGDSLEVRDGFVYINGKKNALPDRARLQFFHTVISKKYLSPKFFEEDLGITEYFRYYKVDKKESGKFNVYEPFPNDPNFIMVKLPGDLNLSAYPQYVHTDRYEINLTLEEKEKLANRDFITSVTRNLKAKGDREPGIFPHHENYNWNTDNFGPIYIPEAGKTVTLNREVLPLYKQIITEYEGNDLKYIGNDIYINGELATTYTFKQDYYWMMGDNRQYSQDARAWGYVPFNHVVGKPVFVWMSISGVEKGFKNIKNWKLNTDRIFTTVHGSGEKRSYFSHFLAIILIWQGFKFYRKKKKKTEE